MTNPTDRLEGAVYHALRDFQQTADWPQLRLAQMRQHLAEHIARDLSLTPGALPAAPADISADDLAHALDNSTPYPIELTSTVARFMAERLLEMLTISKRAEHPVWQPEEQPEPGEQPQPQDPDELRPLTAEDPEGSEPDAVRRETVLYFLECRAEDGGWESPILTLEDLDEANRQLAAYRGEMPHFEYRVARQSTTVVVQPLPESAREAQQDPTQDGTVLAAENEALWGELHRRDTETDQPHPVARQDPTQDGEAACVHPDGYDGECPCPPSCACCTPAAVARPGQPETDGAPADTAQQPKEADSELTALLNRCPAAHGALGRICELPTGHAGMHTGSGPNGGAVWDGDAS